MPIWVWVLIALVLLFIFIKPSKKNSSGGFDFFGFDFFDFDGPDSSDDGGINLMISCYKNTHTDFHVTCEQEGPICIEKLKEENGISLFNPKGS